tara:strand:+ start:2970 stop:3719 length:750 start_codon:yes stop_codon:yes gene_type:complete
MASRFSLVNRGYEVEKVGPSTTNRYLNPPRRVGEITPTTNLRDEKNAKGPLAKVKLTPQAGDDTGIKSASVNTDPSYMTATQLSRSISESRTAKSLTSFFDPTTTTGLIAAGVVPGGGVAAGINVSSTKQISAVQAEAQNRLTAIDKAMRTEEEMAKDTDVQTLISLGARRGVVAEQRARSINKATEAKAFVTASKETISGSKNTPTVIGSEGNDRLRREKNRNQESQTGNGYDYQSDPIEDSPTFGVF